MERQDRGMDVRVVRVRGNLVLCGIADESLSRRERNIGGCCSITPVVGDDLDMITLPDTDAASQVKIRLRWCKGAKAHEEVVPRSIPIAFDMAISFPGDESAA